MGPSHALGLWTFLLFVHLVRWLHRQVPVVMVTMGPMMAGMWLLQRCAAGSVPLSLLGGWAVFLAILVPVMLTQLHRANTAFAMPN